MVASKVQWCGSGGGGGLVVWLAWCCGVLLFRLMRVVQCWWCGSIVWCRGVLVAVVMVVVVVSYSTVML